MNTNETNAVQHDSKWDLRSDMPSHHTARLAQQFTIAAFDQCKKAAVGFVAVPATFVLSTAASVLYVTAIVESGFEMVGASVGEVGRRISGMGSAREVTDRDRNGRFSDQSAHS